MLHPQGSLPVGLRTTVAFLFSAVILGLTSCSAGPSATDRSSEPAIAGDSVDRASPTATTNPSPNSLETVPSASTGAQENSSTALAPGEHCFEHRSETLSADIKLAVAPGGEVKGEATATIHNDAVGYYSSYGQTIQGTLDGQTLEADLVTRIENDVQTSQETWTVTRDRLMDRQNSYSAADCSTFAEGLSRSPSESAAPGSALKATNPLLEAAIAVHQTRVRFAAGSTGTEVENSVIRGERDEYLLGAIAGQTLVLSIRSLEDNASFGLVAPDGGVLLEDSRQAQVTLPQSGDYSLVVGATRGNASYQLAIDIR